MNLDNVHRAMGLAQELKHLRNRIALIENHQLSVVPLIGGRGECVVPPASIQAQIREILVADLRGGETKYLAELSAIGVYDAPPAAGRAATPSTGDTADALGSAIRITNIINASGDSRLAC